MKNKLFLLFIICAPVFSSDLSIKPPSMEQSDDPDRQKVLAGVSAGDLKNAQLFGPKFFTWKQLALMNDFIQSYRSGHEIDGFEDFRQLIELADQRNEAESQYEKSLDETRGLYAATSALLFSLGFYNFVYESNHALGYALVSGGVGAALKEVYDGSSSVRSAKKALADQSSAALKNFRKQYDDLREKLENSPEFLKAIGKKFDIDFSKMSDAEVANLKDDLYGIANFSIAFSAFFQELGLYSRTNFKVGDDFEMLSPQKPTSTGWFPWLKS